MHVVVGATGNVGTALLRALRSNSNVDAVLGVARRLPTQRSDRDDKVRWRAADISRDPRVVAGHRGAEQHLLTA